VQEDHGRLLTDKPLSTKAVAAVTASLTRVLSAQAKYLNLYSQSQGLGPVVSLLDRLLNEAPQGLDTDDPMTITSGMETTSELTD